MVSSEGWYRSFCREIRPWQDLNFSKAGALGVFLLGCLHVEEEAEQKLKAVQSNIKYRARLLITNFNSSQSIFKAMV